MCPTTPSSHFRRSHLRSSAFICGFIFSVLTFTNTAAAQGPREAFVQGMAEAVNGGNVEALGPAFRGSVPEWARDWVERRRERDPLRRRWSGAAVRLPRPYRGAEWLAVFSTYHPIESDSDHFHVLRERNGRWELEREIGETEPLDQYRITAHNLEVRLQPETHRVEVTDRMTAERRPGAGALLLARMSEDFQVREVRVRERPVDFARAGGLLAIAVPEQVAPGSFEITLRYGGRVNHPSWDDVAPEGTLLLSYWYPHIGRAPARGTVAVTAPAGWTIVGQGVPRDVTDDGQRSRAVWEQTQPVCWLTLAAGRFHTTRREAGGRTYAVHLRQPDSALAEAALAAIQRSMDLFTTRFGPLPWNRYEVVEYPLGAGAVESYTFTVSRRQLIPRAIAHELAHSWWGGVVPNTYLEDMWSEAFATYSDALTADRPFRVRAARGPGRAGGVPISRAHNALDPRHSPVGYGKGAAVLHMLRRLIGDDAFFRSLQRFREGRAGKASTWRDYQPFAERAAGRDLDWFFDQWLDRAGVPAVTLEDLKATRRGGGWEATLVARQEGEPYRLALPLEFTLADGRRVTRTVEVHGGRAALRVMLEGEPRQVRVDPGGELLLGGERREWEFRPGTAETPSRMGRGLLG